ncbi:nicotinamidase, putative [Cryptococcus deneoformans JEC21]|uniref:nicotinamidase n=1 Tax=Cryptococcus deneoformans (strain JEC21 / ATCC MYA-565) TaxID=214684 RepID=Q5KN44_CRYD1|nr:nicotinamidase, putative [Cryptococcus neoformans var. neoformans JEC21]AAW41306.2 nicotinamidase, putative [Cryptococcus neoformans var. neoformans JEC21]
MASMPASTALIIVDVQNDFLPPTGSLAVPNGREVLPVITGLLDRKWDWAVVVVSQDYHPKGHISFASAHPPNQAYTQLPLVNAHGESYIQTLWPDHCIQGTAGADLESGLAEVLAKRGDVRVVRKGIHSKLEAYSAFQGVVLPTPFPPAPPPSTHGGPETEDVEIVPPKTSELAEFLLAQGVNKVVIAGVATDFCVLQTALSSISSSFPTLLIAPAMRAISPEYEAKTFEAVESLGGVILGRNGEEWKTKLAEWIR